MALANEPQAPIDDLAFAFMTAGDHFVGISGSVVGWAKLPESVLRLLPTDCRLVRYYIVVSPAILRVIIVVDRHDFRVETRFFDSI